MTVLVSYHHSDCVLVAISGHLVDRQLGQGTLCVLTGLLDISALNPDIVAAPRAVVDVEK
jgi:hypothetical protein